MWVARNSFIWLAMQHLGCLKPGNENAMDIWCLLFASKYGFIL